MGGVLNYTSWTIAISAASSQKHRKLGRTSDQRRAMLRAMVTYLLENGQIKTTVTRAKEVAPVAEKMREEIAQRIYDRHKLLTRFLVQLGE